MKNGNAKRLYHPNVTASLFGTRWEAPIEVEISSLNVDARYQVPLSEGRARAIAADFKREAAGAIVVSLREDGSAWIIDGQTRAAAATKVALRTILAWVYTGLTIEQEAELYASLNVVRKTPPSRSVFRARLLANMEPYLSINRVVEDSGLTLSLTNTKASHSISCVGTVLNIWKAGGEDRLSRTLAIVKAAWPGDARAFDGYILYGVSALIKATTGRYTDVRIAERLSTVAPELIVRKAALRKHDTGDEIGRCAGQVMLEHVEKRMRQANRSGALR